jgi:hypothetical protein
MHPVIPSCGLKILVARIDQKILHRRLRRRQIDQRLGRRQTGIQCFDRIVGLVVFQRRFAGFGRPLALRKQRAQRHRQHHAEQQHRPEQIVYEFHGNPFSLRQIQWRSGAARYVPAEKSGQV